MANRTNGSRIPSVRADVMPQAANSTYKTPRRAGLYVPPPALPSGMQAMTPGTVPCVVSEGHDTAGLSPVSWRENAKVKYGNLAFGENTLALRLENASLRESLPGNTPSHSRRLSPRYTRRCRLLALGFPRLKQYSIVLASSLRVGYANRGRALCARSIRTHGNFAQSANICALAAW